MTKPKKPAPQKAQNDNDGRPVRGQKTSTINPEALARGLTPEEARLEQEFLNKNTSFYS
ncbi:MAG TPA: hypothetical protein VHP58_03090 [Alphaproteobacteria bacterium]|nr:hypothetical protein [Alphaproteobacteria bacterium]